VLFACAFAAIAFGGTIKTNATDIVETSQVGDPLRLGSRARAEPTRRKRWLQIAMLAED